MFPDYKAFAKDWEEAWNSHDLNRILSHYTEDVIFQSRKAFSYVGVGQTQGKEQLRHYWQAALDAQPDLKFEVETIFGGQMMLVIVYRNHKNRRAAETLYFRADGLVERASACQEDWNITGTYRLQVDLWVRCGAEDAFARYEHKALANMAGYGGVLISATRPEVGPYERHILAFPSKQAFDAYRQGPEVSAARDERDACIERTEVQELEP